MLYVRFPYQKSFIRIPVHLHQVNFTIYAFFETTNPVELFSCPLRRKTNVVGSYPPNPNSSNLLHVFYHLIPSKQFPPIFFSRTLIMFFDPFRERKKKVFKQKKGSLRNNNYFFHLRLTCRLPKSLEILDLSQNSFGDDGLEEFSRHLPPRCAACFDSWAFGFSEVFFFTEMRCFLMRMGGF